MSAFDFIPLRGPVHYTDECEDVDASDYERPARWEGLPEERTDAAGCTHLAGCRCMSCRQFCGLAPIPNPRKVSGALQVSGILAGLLVTHEPTTEWPEAHRYEVRAGRAGEVSTRATSGTAATFREAWAEVLRFIEGQVRP